MAFSEGRPAGGRIDFSHLIITANNWDTASFSNWVFHPAMLFGAKEKWWGNGGRRPCAHEGLDLCLFEDGKRKTRHVDDTTKIPVMDDCRVMKIMDDFMGKTLILEHCSRSKDDFLEVTFFGHTKPDCNLAVNDLVKKGDLICTVSNPGKKTILPHLHITTALANPKIVYEDLTWDIIPKTDLLRLTDPLPLFFPRYRVLA